MPAFFSSNKQYPLTLKPITSPGDDKIYKDIFNIQNTLRSLLRDLDTILEEYVTEAPEDGKLYGRKDGDWEEITGGGGTSGPLILLESKTLIAETTTVEFTGLNLIADGCYKLELSVPTVPGRDMTANIYLNGDTNNANYNAAYLSNDGTLVGSRVNRPFCGLGWASGSGVVATISASLVIKQKLGAWPVYLFTGAPIDGTSMVTFSGTVRRNSSDNVTSLLFSLPSNFPVGSTFSLYKLTS